MWPKRIEPDRLSQGSGESAVASAKADHRVDFGLTPGEGDLIIERMFIDAEVEGPLQAAQTRIATLFSPDAPMFTISPAMSQPKRIIVKSHGYGEHSKLHTPACRY